VNSRVSLYIGLVRVRRLALAAVIVGLGALVFNSAAQACSCIERTPREALREADAAIVGRLVQVVHVDAYSAEYRYRVRRAYKGGDGIRAGGMISVRSGTNGASCGLPVDTERRYGLFLNRSGGRWSGGLCGLVAPRQLSVAAAELRHGDDVPPAGASSGHSCAS
jgi:hypothetical protein